MMNYLVNYCTDLPAVMRP